MKKIGFIGLGTMGLPMVENLLKAGYELTVYNRTPDKAEILKGKSIKIAKTPAEVAKNSEVVFTMLSVDKVVEEVVLGKDGVLDGASSGLVVIDSSTIMPKTSQQIASTLAKHDVEMLDAPVTGSEPQAIEGVLTFMVGGKKEVYERCIPLFEAMGQKAVYMGDSGAGASTKLANNLVAAVNLASVVEGVILASKAGINPELFLEVLMGGGGGSRMAAMKVPKIVSRDFAPQFKSMLMHKDLTLASNFAAEFNVPTPIMSMTKEIFHMAKNKGLGEEDISTIVKLYEEWAGVEVK